MSDAILLTHANGDSATILPFGAELAAWRADGVDLIWERDDRIWSQTAPVLFPIVGWTRNGEARVDGVTYPLSLHGFAWKKRFEIVERRADYLRLALVDDAETRALYPFSFRFEVEFQLGAGVLENRLTIVNTGDSALPYACGLHPGFRWPLAGSEAEHAIIFETEEIADVPVIAPGGLFSARRRPTPLQGARLPLTTETFAHEALCFLDINSSKLAFDNGAGARLCVTLDDFPHVGFWTLPGAPYLCIEPWTGHGDPEGFTGDLFEKPSMRIVPPGARGRHGAIFAFERKSTSPG